MKKLLSVLLCLCLLLCCGCGASPAAPQSAPVEDAPVDIAAPAAVETPAAEEPAPTEEVADTAEPEPVPEFSPDFTFSTIDRVGGFWNEEVFADHKLTMINFWEPWCGPCVGEMPDLQALYEAYADQGLLILGVYSTQGMEGDVTDVLEQTGVTYPILQYCEEFDIFQSGYVPTTVFVDQAGHVIHRELTAEEKGALSDVIDALGEEQTSAVYVGSNSYEGWAAIIEGLL